MPSIEFYRPFLEPEALQAIGVISVAIAFQLRQRLKAQRPDKNPEELEIHHIQPRYKKGGDNEENLLPLTTAEHAWSHFVLAQSAKNGRDKRANEWAVEAIKSRMTPEEAQRFYDMVETFNESRRVYASRK